jgi:heme A synthase
MGQPRRATRGRAGSVGAPPRVRYVFGVLYSYAVFANLGGWLQGRNIRLRRPGPPEIAALLDPADVQRALKLSSRRAARELMVREMEHVLVGRTPMTTTVWLSEWLERRRRAPPAGEPSARATDRRHAPTPSSPATRLTHASPAATGQGPLTVAA